MGIQKNNVIKDSLTNYSVFPIFMSTELKYDFKWCARNNIFPNFLFKVRHPH